MKCEMVFVVSNKGIMDSVDIINKKIKSKAEIIYAELDSSIEPVNEILKENSNCVLISRGGTAELLRKTFNRSVVEIRVGTYDIAKVLYPLKDSGKKVAVIGYENVISGAKEIADLFEMEIIFLITRKPSDIDNQLKKAREESIDVIVGDGFTSRIAFEYGFETKYIESGYESVLTAFIEAKNLHDTLEFEKLQRLKYETIINSVDDGIIYVDDDGKIEIINKASEKLFKKDRVKFLNEDIDTLIKDSQLVQKIKSGKDFHEHLYENGKDKHIAWVLPIQIDGDIKGTAVTIRDTSEVESLEMKIRKKTFKKGLYAKNTFDDIIYDSKTMKELVDKSKKYSVTDSTILIYGESGTGKELLAQAIHNNSNRKKMPFVALNCAALNKELLLSELFGYTEGSFTGALKSGKRGLFEIAHTGTIFLDEISEMDLQGQTSLLRVIQEKEIMKIGDDKVIPVDIRIIAATNKNLWEMVLSGKFREDLYYRLNVLNLHIPPLRNRKEDIAILANHFLDLIGKEYEKEIKPIKQKEIDKLCSYDWNGNIRELRNIIERLLISGELDLDSNDNDTRQGIQLSLEGSLKEIEQEVVERVFFMEGCNKSSTARRLGITRSTLDNKLKSISIDKY